MSDYNSGTPGPICLKFWLGNSAETQECSQFSFQAKQGFQSSINTSQEHKEKYYLVTWLKTRYSAKICNDMI